MNICTRYTNPIWRGERSAAGNVITSSNCLVVVVIWCSCFSGLWRAEGEWEGQTSDGWMEWWGMQRGWESEIGRARPRIEMVGGDFLSRPRPCIGCSAWEWVSEFLWVVMYCAKINIFLRKYVKGRWCAGITDPSLPPQQIALIILPFQVLKEYMSDSPTR